MIAALTPNVTAFHIFMGIAIIIFAMLFYISIRPARNIEWSALTLGLLFAAIALWFTI